MFQQNFSCGYCALSNWNPFLFRYIQMRRWISGSWRPLKLIPQIWPVLCALKTALCALSIEKSVSNSASQNLMVMHRVDRLNAHPPQGVFNLLRNFYR